MPGCSIFMAEGHDPENWPISPFWEKLEEGKKSGDEKRKCKEAQLSYKELERFERIRHDPPH